MEAQQELSSQDMRAMGRQEPKRLSNQAAAVSPARWGPTFLSLGPNHPWFRAGVDWLGKREKGLRLRERESLASRKWQASLALFLRVPSASLCFVRVL